MKKDKILEKDQWETIEKYKEPVKTVGNFWSGWQVFFRIVYVQKNKISGEIRKI